MESMQYEAASHYSQIPDSTQKTDDTLAHLDASLEGIARKGFIAKVYMILGLQLLMTTGMCFISYFVIDFLEFQVNNPWLMGLCSVAIIGIQIAILCCPAGRQHPINIILLFFFTLGFSYMVSYICAIVAYESGSQVVVVAASMTVAIVSALTVYAIFTKQDFSTKFGIIIVLCIAMLSLGIVSLFAWSPFLDNLYCCLGVILFGIYLVIDTQMIIGGKGRRIQLSMDDYVIGALLLYIDIIQMFLYLLELLSKK